MWPARSQADVGANGIHNMTCPRITSAYGPNAFCGRSRTFWGVSHAGIGARLQELIELAQRIELLDLIVRLELNTMMPPGEHTNM